MINHRIDTRKFQTRTELQHNSNGRPVTVVKVDYKPVRLLFHGGAKSKSDNSSFYYAALNVAKDYKDDGIEVKRYEVDSAKTVIDIINQQTFNSIQSIDFFCHGDQRGLYLIKGSSLNRSIPEAEKVDKNLNASLYGGQGFKTIFGWELSDDARNIQSINYTKFALTAKIEIHGCLTAYDLVLVDNICEDLSEALYAAGKKKAVVIGHTEKANPNIQGSSTTIVQQDYRHGQRRIYQNGNVVLNITKRGRIVLADFIGSLK